MSETTLEAPARKRAEPARAGGPRPCVGLPVQYCHQSEGVVPAVLQSQCRTDPALWNVRIFLGGAQSSLVRAEVRHAESPTPGHWNFLTT